MNLHLKDIGEIDMNLREMVNDDHNTHPSVNLRQTLVSLDLTRDLYFRLLCQDFRRLGPTRMGIRVHRVIKIGRNPFNKRIQDHVGISPTLTQNPRRSL